MKMSLVYRLENKDGGGVYCNTGFNAFDRDRHPLPSSDSLLMDNLDDKGIHKFHFAFNSIGQLRNWFYNDEWLIQISDLGIFLSVYESDEVYVGYSQVVFFRENAKLVGQHNVASFFNL